MTITVHTITQYGMAGELLTLTATRCHRPGIALTGTRGTERQLLERLYAGLRNSGHPPQSEAIDIQIAPSRSPLPADAAVAAAILAITHGTDPTRLATTAVLGEIGLDGALRPTRAILPATQTARAFGLARVVVPAANGAEAALVDGIEVLGAATLTDLARWLSGHDDALTRPEPLHVTRVPEGATAPRTLLTGPVQRIAEIAAAGGHHLHLDVADRIGMMLPADWIWQLMPELTPGQQRDLAAINSLCGTRHDLAPPSVHPPMVTLHSSDSTQTLTGQRWPGALSRAHHGLLVVPELDSFHTTSLQAVHQALLRREISVPYQGTAHLYPAAFQVIAIRPRDSVWRRGRVPSELAEALDIQLPADTRADLLEPRASSLSTVNERRRQARARVAAARERATARWSTADSAHADIPRTNAVAPVEQVRAQPLGERARALLRATAQSLGGARTDTVLRLALTAADLDGADQPSLSHIQEAITLHQPKHPRTTDPWS